MAEPAQASPSVAVLSVVVAERRTSTPTRESSRDEDSHLPDLRRDNALVQRGKYCRMQSTDSNAAVTVRAALDKITDKLTDLSIAEGTVYDGVTLRQADTAVTLNNWKARIRDLQPEFVDQQRRLEAIGLDIPHITSSDRTQIPELFCQHQQAVCWLHELQKRSQDMLELVQSRCYQQALAYYKQQTTLCSQVLTGWFQTQAGQVSRFQAQFLNIDETLKSQTEAHRYLLPPVRHAIITLHQETWKEFKQAVSNLKVGGELIATVNKLKEDSSTRIQDVERLLNTVGQVHEPLLGAPPALLSNDEMKTFGANAVLKGFFQFSAPGFFRKIWLYGSTYRETERIGYVELADAAKAACKLHDDMKERLKALSQGNLPASENTLADEFTKYRNMLATLQKKLSEILKSDEKASTSLFDREFNALLPKVIAYANGLSLVLSHLQHVHNLIQQLSGHRFSEVAGVQRDCFTFLRTKLNDDLEQQASLTSVQSLYAALGKLTPYVEELQHNGAVRSEAAVVPRELCFPDRLLTTRVTMLSEALAVHGPNSLDLTKLEQRVLTHIISQKSLDDLRVGSDNKAELPASVKAYFIKVIAQLKFISLIEKIDIEHELFVYVLKNHVEYHAALEVSLKNDAFRTPVADYERLARDQRLPDPVLAYASDLFKFIHNSIPHDRREPLAYANAWQVFFEYSSVKYDQTDPRFVEMQALAAKKLDEIAKDRNYLAIPPEARSAPLQEFVGKEIKDLTVKQGVFMRALGASIFAKDPHEREVGHQIVCNMTDAADYATLFVNHESDMYALLCESTMMKLHELANREHLGKMELALWRAKGPMSRYLKEKIHPAHDPRILWALHNLVRVYEGFNDKVAISTQTANGAMPTVRAMVDVWKEEGFLTWLKAMDQALKSHKEL